jgi:hypothetical protein
MAPNLFVEKLKCVEKCKFDAKVLTPLQATQNPTKTTDEKDPQKRITIQNTMSQHLPKHKRIVVSIVPKNN